MIVYSENKQVFLDDVNTNAIHRKILAELKRYLGTRVGDSEVAAFRNSMKFMASALNNPDIPPDAGVSIEYNIPLTNKRVDFILTGRDDANVDTVVIIELKQWSKVEATTKDGIVSTVLGGGIRETSHPSYQAWSYAALIEDFNETVRQDSIALRPCAYLHNLDCGEAINDPFYKEHTDKAPVFISGDAQKLSEFLKRFVIKGDADDIMYRIEHGKIRPSKDLANSLASMIKGNTEFLMIDDQKLVYETALSMAANANTDQKQILIVEGGPGTGKSVVAINLLVELTKRGQVAQYASKNQAPRIVYGAKLKGTITKNRIDNLFKGSASFTGVDGDLFDTLIVDESHRLVAKNRYKKDSENQVKEIIHASKVALFFVDEAQMVTWSDIGTKEEIRSWAQSLGADIKELTLSSQFRCNGSDGYLSWVDNALQLHDTANPTPEDIDYEFRVFDDPAALKQAIVEKNIEANKARMVAGYCWDWISDSRKPKNDPNAMDIVIPEHGFQAQWNLSKDGSLWIMAPNSVQEIGCIHTCQGLELDYIGVLIGEDLIVRDGKVVTDASKRSKMDSSIRGFKKLLDEDPESAKNKADIIIKNTYRTLMTRGQKGCYLFSVDPETNEYFKQRAAAIARHERNKPKEKHPGLPLEIVEIPEEEHYVSAVPLMSIKAAAGGFSIDQQLEVCDWVKLPEPFSHKPGYFVAQVLGESMNRRIPNGAWCLFKSDQGGSRNGKIVLVQASDIQDTETGGNYTVKRYQSIKRPIDGESWEHDRILLQPMSTFGEFKDVELRDEQLETFSVIGEFVAVL